VTEQGKLLEKWTGYFEKLLNCDDAAEKYPRMNITTIMIALAQQLLNKKLPYKSKG